jgi:hypothetical protein
VAFADFGIAGPTGYGKLGSLDDHGEAGDVDRVAGARFWIPSQEAPMALESFDRHPLLFGPSPVPPLERLSEHLGGARIWPSGRTATAGWPSAATRPASWST